MAQVGVGWFSSGCSYRGFPLQKLTSSAVHATTKKVTSVNYIDCSNNHRNRRSLAPLNTSSIEKKSNKKQSRETEHHLWMKRDSAESGHKALNLVHIISELPNEKTAVYGALDKWTAWETEFPLIAAAKALRILRQRSRWSHVIQVAKWMLSKGQGLTMGTYDTLLLAFDMDGRVDEAETLWNMIVHTHTRSISRRLCSRMISLYHHHHMPDKVIEVNVDTNPYNGIGMRNVKKKSIYCKGKFWTLHVFADMEELGVKPDEDTVKRVARAFQELGQEENEKLFVNKYQCKWKYLHFNGERVKVKRDGWNG
ncbi:hypothetical protein C5167_039203 [Papaver somniferum]|uniref:Pentatricopeptide repeat-containing protein n=1 Tax=Papaver somniferum TaxID=3469 RepID=A0A4Y7IDX8_PAPSO|nr:hypothetical protein C5167_039203 [Papaver somniferum]